MDQQSILYSTLQLFAVSGAIALAVMALIIVWVVSKGRRRARRSARS
jgi:ABC-type lipoprotein release transport system permease subunit